MFNAEISVSLEILLLLLLVVVVAGGVYVGKLRRRFSVTIQALEQEMLASHAEILRLNREKAQLVQKNSELNEQLASPGVTTRMVTTPTRETVGKVAV